MDGTTLQQVHEYIIITRTSLFIEHLKRNKTYIVAIQARNEVGYGAAATISATTLLAGPPDAPSITNTTVDGKQCFLQWTKPYNGESPIGIYTIYIWVTNNGNVNSWNTTETNYTLELDWAKITRSMYRRGTSTARVPLCLRSILEPEEFLKT
ncbi:hypothetical protein OS493_024207 [Desmophyllum pertusum]|uniref:Fibronectin type-III domain-containing protein n=1 Tax=Desmophyllum pertusum TaxID=174260 RepID=A0A9W9ZAU1_9CNID|nr:hypothetical protein OS493_024207 [Desmophyllum pertusum]